MATVFMCWQLSSGAGAGTQMDKNGVENVYFTAPNNRINSRENAPKKKNGTRKDQEKSERKTQKEATKFAAMSSPSCTILLFDAYQGDSQ